MARRKTSKLKPIEVAMLAIGGVALYMSYSTQKVVKQRVARNVAIRAAKAAKEIAVEVFGDVLTEGKELLIDGALLRMFGPAAPVSRGLLKSGN